ncbi:MAG: hypothetical protein MI861_19760 [Pirellulales bacterium]|nr:hypothetical protein [Pirellulales bacterium]
MLRIIIAIATRLQVGKGFFSARMPLLPAQNPDERFLRRNTIAQSEFKSTAMDSSLGRNLLHSRKSLSVMTMLVTACVSTAAAADRELISWNTTRRSPDFFGEGAFYGGFNGDGLPDVISGNKKGTHIHLQVRKKVSEKDWRAAQRKVSNGSNQRACGFVASCR